MDYPVARNCHSQLTPAPMRSPFLLVIVALVLCSSGSASQPADPVLIRGLKAWYENGAEAALHTWYSDSPELAAKMKERLLPAVQDLGTVLDSELIATHPISNRVTRYYFVVYFNRTPLWLQIERYANGTTAFYLPLRFSTDPDRILPRYLTEFQL